MPTLSVRLSKKNVHTRMPKEDIRSCVQKKPDKPNYHKM